MSVVGSGLLDFVTQQLSGSCKCYCVCIGVSETALSSWTNQRVVISRVFTEEDCPSVMTHQPSLLTDSLQVLVAAIIELLHIRHRVFVVGQIKQ